MILCDSSACAGAEEMVLGIPTAVVVVEVLARDPYYYSSTISLAARQAEESHRIMQQNFARSA